MPTMTASTITFTPEATMLPSTFSARKAVLLKSAKAFKRERTLRADAACTSPIISEKPKQKNRTDR